MTVLTLPTRCNVFGDDAPVRHNDIALSMTPTPYITWICPNCDDLHYWSLNVERYDWLTMRRFDFAAALNGSDIPVTP